MRCLLIEHPTGSCSSTRGSANKENEKFHDIYGIENAGGAIGPTQLEERARRGGVRGRPTWTS